MSEPEAHCQQLDDLAEEFAERIRRGESPTVSEYATRHAELAAEIRDLFPTIAALERLKAKRAQPQGQPASLGGARLERLGDFHILREIGRGGMGIVYEAEQESLGRRVAIKVLPKHALVDSKQLKRFHREARIVARLQHPNIVAVFGVGEHEGFHYFIMQLIRGVGLDKIVAQLAQARSCGVAGLETETFVASPTAGGVSLGMDSQYWESVARIGLQAARALHYAHTEGTLHCDIKPANLLVDPAGFLWIADFGVAKAVHADKVTRTGDVTGTLQYMAPERFRGQTDERTDVYSLGMTLYELLTLHSPYSDGDRAGVVRRILEESPTPPRALNPQIPLDLETIVLKATARDPHHRYASAGDLGDDLRRYLDGEPIKGRRATRFQRSWHWCRRNPVTAGLAAAVAVLTIVLVSLIPVIQRSARQPAQNPPPPNTVAPVAAAQESNESAHDVPPRHPGLFLPPDRGPRREGDFDILRPRRHGEREPLGFPPPGPPPPRLEGDTERTGPMDGPPPRRGDAQRPRRPLSAGERPDTERGEQRSP